MFSMGGEVLFDAHCKCYEFGSLGSDQCLSLRLNFNDYSSMKAPLAEFHISVQSLTSSNVCSFCILVSDDDLA